jgi:hypothetical protein
LAYARTQYTRITQMHATMMHLQEQILLQQEEMMCQHH